MEAQVLTAEQAIQILNSRKLIPAIDGYYAVKVTSVTPFEERFIANFNAMTDYHFSEAKRLLLEGEIDEAVNQNLSVSLRATDYIPSKGEILEVYVSEITTKNGVTGRFVTAIKEVKAKATSKVSFSLEDIKTPAEAVTKATATSLN